MGLDKRIGPSYLDVGIGYGGSCFGKDVKALAALAERFDYHPELLNAVMDINRDQRMLVIDKLRDCLEELEEKAVGLLGLAFKPNTDDRREAPSLDLARVLLAAGAHVRAYDPAAMEGATATLPAARAAQDAARLAAGGDGAARVGNPASGFRQANVSEGGAVEGDWRYVRDFGSPASRPQYDANPIHTVKGGTVGTMNMLGLARAKSATFLLASTSEVYGDPLVHPQPESYWGNVNPIGPRGCYDEAKRAAEAFAIAYDRAHHVDTPIIPIFNTHGPRMPVLDA